MLNALVLLLAPLLAASPAKPRVLVMQLTAGEGVNAGTAQAITAAVLGEVRKRPSFAVMSPTDVQAVLSVERQKQLLGCSEGTCLADIGGALGVEKIVTGSAAKLGESWMLHLQLVDARNASVLRSADRRKKGGTVDDVLDELPKMVAELFGAAPAATPLPPPVAAVSAPPPPEVKVTPVSLPSPIVEQPAKISADVRAKLHLVTDGAGHYLAFVPFDTDAPLFAGDAHALSAQAVMGGGSEGTTEFDSAFWEPRSVEMNHGGFEFRNAKYTLSCGKSVRELKPVDAKHAKAILAKAKLLAFRWQRQAIALGRDEDGNYYFVDAPRSDGNLDDAHLYIGPRGHMVPTSVTDAVRASGKLEMVSAAGKLELPLGDVTAQTPAGSFKAGGATRAVTAMDLWQNRALIYARLGVYPKALGTACDVEFAP